MLNAKDNYGLSFNWDIKPDFKQISAAFVLAWRGFKFLGWSRLLPVHIHAHFTTHLLREKPWINGYVTDVAKHQSAEVKAGQKKDTALAG